jgi:rod shape determining protein RodA
MLAQAGFPKLYLFLIFTPFISMITSFHIFSFVGFALFLLALLLKLKKSSILIISVLVVNIFFLFITPVVWGQLRPYQQNRIITFVDPSRDPLNTGYQIIQARIAIASGQLTGKGFLEGTQKNMNFLPEHHTDFIFSVVAEEFGFIGSMILFVLFFLFFLRLIKNIYNTKNRERRLVTSGVFGFIFFQVTINLGMNLGLMPTTGIPLPLISYGGSNLLVNAIAVSIVLKYSQEKEV